MNSNKSSYLKLFNNHLNEFIDDVLTIFPNDLDLHTCATFLKGIRKINPKMTISSWNQWVTKKYRIEIEACNLQFFENKDYKQDLEGSEDEQNILNTIERIRTDVKQCGEENKKKTMKYLQNLTKLSDLYFMN
jgi:hypothetical protein